MKAPRTPEQDELEGELWAFLSQLEEWLDGPMVALGFTWLVLVVVDLVWGLSPLLATINTAIWGLFVIDFLLRFVLAPNKGAYLRRNWLTALSLAVPALRVVRLVRLARLTPAARSLRLVSVVGSMNRGMRALRTSLGRHGAGYVFGLTVIVSLLGAAGMLAFEQHPDGTGLRNYGEALWWTVMMITTIGSDYWPVTPEGRTLTLLLSIYGMGVLGFVTATLASFFVGRDAQGAPGGQGNPRALEELRREVARLREELARRRPPE